MNIVITGASSGIGEALARRYLDAGHTVWTLARRADRLPGCGIHCDISSPTDVAKAAEQIDGPVDVLVNNAGAGLPGEFADADIERVAHTVDVNLTGAMRVTHALLPKMARGSTIVFVASVAGRVGLAGSSVYCSTKFGMIGFAEALRAELVPRDVRVLTVNPGPIATEGFPHAALRRSLFRGVVRSADQCAAAIMRAVDAKRSTIYVPSGFRSLLAVARLAMPVTQAVMKRVPFRAGR